MSAARHPNDLDGPPDRRTRAQPLVASYRPSRPKREGTRGRMRAYRPLVYLAPVLLALTFLTVVDVARTPQGSQVSTPGEQIVEEGPTPAMSNPDGPTVQADGAPTNPARTAISAELPGGGPFPTQGAGTFHVVPGTSEQIGQGRLSTYTVEVENDIVFTDGDTAFATVVQATLSHPKSWTGNGSTALRRIDTGTPDLRVTLASQATARRLCGFDIPYDTSCFLRAKPGHVVLNAARWERGAQSFQGDIGQYRRYVVNHEVGHFFNNPHQPCAGQGALAPLMMQQTLTTANDELSTLVSDIQNDIAVPRDGRVCKPNEWLSPTSSTPSDAQGERRDRLHRSEHSDRHRSGTPAHLAGPDSRFGHRAAAERPTA